MKIRTSQTDPIRIDTVDCSPGESGLTICPGKQGLAMDGTFWKRDPDSDFALIRLWGAAMIIGLMEPSEYQMLNVANIAEMASRNQLRYELIPIPDGDAPGPDALEIWTHLAPEVHEILDAGERVLVHCRGGLGRTGTLVAMILIERGIAVQDAIQSVRAVRPGAIETERQEKFLERYVVRKK